MLYHRKWLPLVKTCISFVVMQIICRNPTVMERIRSVVSITSSELFSTSVTSIFFGDTWLRLWVKSSTSIPPTSIRISFPLPDPPYHKFSTIRFSQKLPIATRPSVLQLSLKIDPVRADSWMEDITEPDWSHNKTIPNVPTSKVELFGEKAIAVIGWFVMFGLEYSCRPKRSHNLYFPSSPPDAIISFAPQEIAETILYNK